jgi:hypothetical protein
MCVAPKLSGKSLGAATQALAGASCKAGTVRRPRHAPKRRPPKHKKWRLVVISQSAAPGATAGPAGTVVNLMLGYKALK